MYSYIKAYKMKFICSMWAAYNRTPCACAFTLFECHFCTRKVHFRRDKALEYIIHAHPLRILTFYTFVNY